jgi:hypothetical protein
VKLDAAFQSMSLHQPLPLWTPGWTARLKNEVSTRSKISKNFDVGDVDQKLPVNHKEPIGTKL